MTTNGSERIQTKLITVSGFECSLVFIAKQKSTVWSMNFFERVDAIHSLRSSVVLIVEKSMRFILPSHIELNGIASLHNSHASYCYVDHKFACKCVFVLCNSIWQHFKWTESFEAFFACVYVHDVYVTYMTIIIHSMAIVVCVFITTDNYDKLNWAFCCKWDKAKSQFRLVYRDD